MTSIKVCVGVFEEADADLHYTNILDGFLEYESRNHPGIHITFTNALTSYKICVSVSEEGHADLHDTTYKAVSYLENFKEAVVRQVPSMDHLN